jgi:hypothetical protein
VGAARFVWRHLTFICLVIVPLVRLVYLFNRSPRPRMLKRTPVVTVEQSPMAMPSEMLEIPSFVPKVARADALYQVLADTPLYEVPNRDARVVSEIHQGRCVHVVGTSEYFVAIRLKSGLVGFAPNETVEYKADWLYAVR